MFCCVRFQDDITGFVDDEGNWTQFAWFALVGDARLYCGRMVMLGENDQGGSADVTVIVSREMVEDRVVWLSDAGAIEHAEKYMAAMAQSAADSELPVISLDTGLVERIKEAVANKERKRFARLENRSFRSIPESDDYPHVGAVKIYEGDDDRGLLPPCNDHVNHSPDGFAWGYGGSGPAQLAYAILFSVTEDRDKTQEFYQLYKWSVVCRLPEEPWTITAASVLDWLDEAEASKAQEHKLT
jgi:hypothetical protein